MEAECASYCTSLDAICEESELIAYLQSEFWSSSDFEANVFSSNNENTNASVDLHVDNISSPNKRNTGIKRKIQVDEPKGQDKEACTTLLVPKDTCSFTAQSDRSRAEKDSQSQYAKRRRKSINERLRILQELIPNGTKVDISTMLQEAVHYVKFLHLQIKLLSSDKMWMYAPLAFNGVDISLRNLNYPAQER